MDGPSFSETHYQNAIYLLIDAMELEELHEEEGHDVGEHIWKKRWTLHNTYILMSLISSFSYVEAHINEIYHAALTEAERLENGENLRMHQENDRFYRMITRLNDEARYRTFPDNPTLNKYQLYLIYLDVEPFDRGVLPFQNVDLVRRLRNYYIHFEPEVIENRESGEIEHKLGRTLEGKFDTNPFGSDQRSILPGNCLSVDAARWIANSCNDFVNEFNARSGIDSSIYVSGFNFDVDKMIEIMDPRVYDIR